MQRHRDAADVPAVADREQREHADQSVFGRVHRADDLGGSDSGTFDDLGRNRVPARARYE